MTVYLIQCGEGGPVKIGKADRPEERLAALQTAHYERLQIVRVWEGAEEEERALHAFFRKHHIRGEWYRAHPEIVAADPQRVLQALRETKAHEIALSKAPRPPSSEHVALLAAVESALPRLGIAETTFGRLAVNDGKFVSRLRAGRNMTLATIDRARSFIKQQEDERAA